MVRLRRPDYFLLLLLIAFSCGKDLPTLEGVDTEQWRADKNGCEGQRKKMIDAFTQEKDKLLSLSELDLVQLLGKPDQNELYTRNQKFYFYYIDAAPECSTPSENPHRLMVRFNAVGLAQEVLVE